MPLHGRRFAGGAALSGQSPPLGDGGSAGTGTGGTTLASGATGTGSFKLARGIVLNSITADKASRVRFYGTLADANKDKNRKIGTPSNTNIGCQAEFDFATPNQTITCSPKPTIVNLDSPQTDAIYYSITNLSGGSATIGLTLNYTPYL